MPTVCSRAATLHTRTLTNMANKKREGRYESGEGPRHERGESRRYEKTEKLRESLARHTANRQRTRMNSAMQEPAGSMRISGKTKRK